MIVKFNSIHEIDQPGITSQKQPGNKTTRLFPLSAESKFKFPDCPAVRESGIDPAISYSIEDLKLINNGKVFVQESETHAAKIVLYRQSTTELINRANNYAKT